MDEIIVFFAQILAITTVLTAHEFAHAYVAYRFGDPTAKEAGRMTLNPFKHFDLIGLAAFVFTRFGWAKPVPINPNRFKNKRKGYLWTSAAGILTNYIGAFLLYPALHFAGQLPITHWATFLYVFLLCGYQCSLSFSVFNLLPLYPLDGFRIAESIYTKRTDIGKARKYSSYLLIGLVLIHYLSDRFAFLAYADLLGFALEHVMQLVAMPITYFWSIFF